MGWYNPVPHHIKLLIDPYADSATIWQTSPGIKFISELNDLAQLMKQEPFNQQLPTDLNFYSNHNRSNYKLIYNHILSHWDSSLKDRELWQDPHQPMFNQASFSIKRSLAMPMFSFNRRMYAASATGNSLRYFIVEYDYAEDAYYKRSKSNWYHFSLFERDLRSWKSITFFWP